MSGPINIDPSNQTFSELMSNDTRYMVPRFQRDYSWEQEHWEDLWNDIRELPQEGSHYMGYIVLQQKERREYEIIDGQQRLVTLTLLILAYMAKLKELIEKNQEADENNERLEEIEKRYVGVKNLITLAVSSKITLNRNNKLYFKDICKDLKPANPRGLNRSNGLLRKAFEYFRSQITATNGRDIAQDIDNFSSNLVFTKITVLDSINAYKVFETLNARGVQLSTPDLIKNYIFSVIDSTKEVSEGELDDLDEKWSHVIDQLGEKNFTDFIRYFYNSEHHYTTKKDLFRKVRDTYDSPQKAAYYLNALEDKASLYASLLNPHDDWWSIQFDDYRAINPFLDAFQLFSIRQPIIILLAAYDKFTHQEYIKLAKYLYVLTIRYNIIGNYSANEQEKKYNAIAQKITNESYTRASHVKNGEEYQELYPSDDNFKSAFAFYKMPSRRSSKKIRYLLAQIEKHLGRDINYIGVSLEHVCPYNPDQDWHKSFGEGIHDISDRLGNMVLLDKDQLGRVSFVEKRKEYLESPYQIARKVAQYEEWNLANVNEYQLWLAEQAVRTWRVD